MAGVESSGNPNAVSRTGAVGLMQLEPGTAKEMGVTDPRDPMQSIYGGARYLATLLRRYHGNLALAIAAYNAGPGAVDAAGGIPQNGETPAYVNKVLAGFLSGG